MSTDTEPTISRASAARFPARLVGLSAAMALPTMFGVLWFFAQTEIDLKVQDRLFDFASCQWLVARDAVLPKMLLYSGPKLLFMLAAGVLIALLAWPERRLHWLPGVLRRRQRRTLGFVLASMVLLPGVVAILKDASWVPCPYDVDRYCGELPHLRPFERDPSVTAQRPQRGGCFPAAHASGAFSLMALYFVGRTRRQRLALLTAAVALGWLTGAYQMARGAHFLSHNVSSMLLAWPVVTALAWVFGLFPGPRLRPGNAPPAQPTA